MSASVLKLLSHLPLFQAVSPEQLASLLGSVTERRLAKGECLFRRGDAASAFYAVAYGQVKLVIPSPQGAEKVVELIGPRQSLGEAVMFLGKPYPVTAEALEDSLLLRIERTAVDRLLAEDPSFARKMLAGLSVRLHSLLRDVETYSQRSGTQRVIGYLLQHGGDEDSPAGESLSVELPTAKQVIASRLNLTPETFSRSLAELARAGLIDVQGRTITVASVRRLREYEP